MCIFTQCVHEHLDAHLICTSIRNHCMYLEAVTNIVTCTLTSTKVKISHWKLQLDLELYHKEIIMCHTTVTDTEIGYLEICIWKKRICFSSCFNLASMNLLPLYKLCLSNKSKVKLLYMFSVILLLAFTFYMPVKISLDLCPCSLN